MDGKGSLTHQQALVVAAFLGGMAFTSLVLILQSSDRFEPAGWGFYGAAYFFALVTIIGVAIAAFVLTSVTWIGVAGGSVSTESKAADFAAYTFTIGLVGLLVVLPLLMLPFSWPASVVVTIATLGMFLYFVNLPTEDH
jgi:hypothetical protein